MHEFRKVYYCVCCSVKIVCRYQLGLWNEREMYLTWILCHRQCHSCHHSKRVHLSSGHLYRMVNFPFLFHRMSIWIENRIEFFMLIIKISNFRFQNTFSPTLSFSSNFRPRKRDSMFDSGLSLFVGEPPKTYSTILTPRPPVESRGLSKKTSRTKGKIFKWNEIEVIKA